MDERKIILLKYGEMSLKGQNRPVFESRLLDNIRARLVDLGDWSVRKGQCTVYVEPPRRADSPALIGEATRRLKKVFGAANLAVADVCPKELSAVEAAVIEHARRAAPCSFKIETKREDKRFPLNSPQLNARLGEAALEAVSGLRVDVRNPEVVINVEIRGDAFVYSEKETAASGMPTGTGGRAMLLLSGGIDSPVAGHMIAKRGVVVEAVHFYSYPYTSERAKDKVIELAALLSEWTGQVRLHIVPFTKTQVAINQKCSPEYMTVIMRRCMVRIAERIAKARRAQALITGESVGQVASQTMEGLIVTDSVADMPVFRPCIGMDKEEIVTRAKKIGTYETSILPYEDCCTVFTPKHPKTKPKEHEAAAQEALIDMEALLSEAVAGVETVTLKHGKQAKSKYSYSDLL